VWLRIAGVWIQGATLRTATSVTGKHGSGVGLSADGRTALVGAAWDGPLAGAAYLYSLVGPVVDQTWKEHFSKRVGTGAIDSAQQGASVAMSGDGHTALVGGPMDNFNAGAAWVFVTLSAGDFNGDTFTDILWRHASGGTFVWFMYGTAVASSGP